MKYAFVFASVVAIWIAIIMMALVVTDTATITFLHETAIAVTLVLFFIGFRMK